MKWVRKERKDREGIRGEGERARQGNEQTNKGKQDKTYARKKVRGEDKKGVREDNGRDMRDGKARKGI